MAFPEIRAFVEECQAVETTLGKVTSEDWRRPALGEWSLLELICHLRRGADRILIYLDEDPGGDAPVVDRVGYFRFDADAAAAGSAQRAREEAAAWDPTMLPSQFATQWRASVRRAEVLPPEHLIATFRGPMRLDEYVATRVLEIVVHHMDVCATLAIPPVSTPHAARMTMALLEGLLGSRRPRNMGRARFIQAATGRIPTEDPRLPVLR